MAVETFSIDVVKLDERAVLPDYKTEGAAGADLYACIDAPIILESLARTVIPTGLAMAIPEGFEVQIRPRSSLTSKHGITILNTPGTIDNDYRGEVGLIVANLSPDPYTIEPGERLAQMVLARFSIATWNVVDKLDETVRGDGGYGSTGSGKETEKEKE